MYLDSAAGPQAGRTVGTASNGWEAWCRWIGWGVHGRLDLRPPMDRLQPRPLDLPGLCRLALTRPPAHPCGIGGADANKRSPLPHSKRLVVL